jgi:hypothetical protein
VIPAAPPLSLRQRAAGIAVVAGVVVLQVASDGHETSLFVGPSLGTEGQGLHVPVSRDRSQAVKDMLLADTTGLRRP